MASPISPSLPGDRPTSATRAARSSCAQHDPGRQDAQPRLASHADAHSRPSSWASTQVTKSAGYPLFYWNHYDCCYCSACSGHSSPGTCSASADRYNPTKPCTPCTAPVVLAVPITCLSPFCCHRAYVPSTVLPCAHASLGHTCIMQSIYRQSKECSLITDMAMHTSPWPALPIAFCVCASGEQGPQHQLPVSHLQVWHGAFLAGWVGGSIREGRGGSTSACASAQGAVLPPAVQGTRRTRRHQLISEWQMDSRGSLMSWLGEPSRSQCGCGCAWPVATSYKAHAVVVAHAVGVAHAGIPLAIHTFEHQHPG